MNHEEYAWAVAEQAVPLERYRANTKLQHECRGRHIIVATPEQMLAGKKCAHCNEVEANALEIIKLLKGTHLRLATGKPYMSKKTKMLLLLDRDNKGRPVPLNDLINGLYPEQKLPEIKGMYLYYMKIRDYWKIGISNNPWRRLVRLRNEIIWVRYYDSERGARNEEAAIKYKYREFRNKDRKALDGEGGWTELFTKDIFA